jgi:hypothetical protein
MKKYSKIDVIKRIEQRAYKLRHRRYEGFDDESLESNCIVHEIKYLFNMLDKDSQTKILNKPWLD